MHITHRSLPAWTYSNPEFFELERQQLFSKSWQLVCHTADIPEPGDYFTLEILGQSLVVIRGHNGQARGFHNVCRHRGTRLLDGPSGNCAERITCPYHAWSYGLDGRLATVPYEQEFKGLKRQDNGLKPLDLEIFAGFIFVRVTADDGPSVAAQFSAVSDELKDYRFEDLKPLGRVTLRRRAVNWKQIADNYVDALHIPVAHPGLSSLVGNSYRIEVAGDIHKMTADLRPSRKAGWSVRAYSDILPPLDHLPGPAGRRWLYYRMWPNLAFDIYPDQIDFMQFIPLSPGQTLIREMAYALPDERREMRLARYLNWRINRVVNSEDTALVERVQAGMASASYSSGPLAESEVCLIDSARRLRALLPVAERRQEPEAGSVASLNRSLGENPRHLQTV
ncbi:MAG: aromatic ring-hydroxylating dioxygenase subunit alpha [Proteobacteria bacterium]|nr:aromatic ring-hydroxylating dioxygenase subunit alpha [Pseudomonadota bacterium]